MTSATTEPLPRDATYCRLRCRPCLDATARVFSSSISLALPGGCEPICAKAELAKRSSAPLELTSSRTILSAPPPRVDCFSCEALRVRMPPSQTRISSFRTSKSLGCTSFGMTRMLDSSLGRLGSKRTILWLSWSSKNRLPLVSDVSACGPINSTSSLASAMPTELAESPSVKRLTTVSSAAAARSSDPASPATNITKAIHRRRKCDMIVSMNNRTESYENQDTLGRCLRSSGPCQPQYFL